MFGFFILVWENSIGNINAPDFTDDVDMEKDKNRIFAIYFVWLLNQFFVLIILLNFLIAVISQSYENVMNSSTPLKYKDRARMSREAYQVLKYFPCFNDIKHETLMI